MDQKMEVLINSMKAIYDNGERLYATLQKQRPDGCEIIIAPLHLGDTVWLCSFIKAFKEQHGCNNVMMVIKESQKVIAECFPDIDAIYAITIADMNAIEFFIGINMLWNHDHIRWGFMEFAISVSYGQYISTLLGPYQSLLLSNRMYLDLKPDTMPARMRIPEFVQSSEMQEKFGNAVLLMPGAESRETGSVPASFWTSVAKALARIPAQ